MLDATGTEVDMLALDCPRHGHRVLLDIGRIVQLVNLGDGLIMVVVRCYDGELITGITGTAATLSPETVGHRPAEA
jgi:hypothetical protein